MVLARFVCGIVLHMLLSTELEQGLIMMKYAVNHPWKFINYRHAFLSGFMQTIMVVGVEIVNFLAVLDQTSFSEIVMNFTALVIISEFDDFFFNAYKDEDLKDAITNDGDVYKELLMIRRTSSIDAKPHSNQNIMTQEHCERENFNQELPRYIYVDFCKGRSCCNKMLFVIYKVLKCLYTSAWFYFMPYATIICSYTIPLIYRQ